MVWNMCAALEEIHWVIQYYLVIYGVYLFFKVDSSSIEGRSFQPDMTSKMGNRRIYPGMQYSAI
jgi:hypothetical protein